MKKNSLTTAVVAGLAGVAGIANISNAVNLNPDGIGQVLIYPYYTVNAGNDTLISVVNTTNTGKAVKVRFLEGRNSREVLDFNLYLSEFDVWTAGVFSLSPTGPGNLTTADNSCTVPGIKSGGLALPTLPSGQRYVEFRNFAYTGVGASDDRGPNDLGRTREGYIEMIEMGTLVDGSDSDRAATHVGGVPRDCPSLEDAWSDGGYWTDGGGTVDLTAPTGGLYGGGAIVNVANGTYINYNADAIERFSAQTQHTEPGSVQPNLARAVTCLDPLGCLNPVNGVTTPPLGADSIVFDNGNLIVSSWAPLRTIDAVSAVFAYDNLINEYTVETGLAAKSEWVATFPTKRFYVDPFIVGGADQTNTAGAIAPFTSRFVGPEGAGQACERINIVAYDREERRPSGTINFSPAPPEGFTALCFEAQVITFNQSGTVSQILGATYARNISTSFGSSGVFSNGWVNIGLSGNNHISRTSIDLDAYLGLPVTGFWALTVENQNATPGVRGFYGGAFRHRGTRECVNAPNAQGVGGLCPN